MAKVIRVLLVVGVVGAIAAGGFLFYRNRLATAATGSTSSYTQTVEVSRGNLDASISVVGQLDAEQSAGLTFQHTNGTTKLESVDVAAGNTVKAGQVLATIDAAPYQQELDQAQSDLQAAEETLADLETPATELEIAQADLNVARSQYQLAKARDALDELEHPDLARLQMALANAQSTLAKAQSDLLSQQDESSYKTQLDRLVTAEATPSSSYNRLAAETYSDAYYQDRLAVAYNKLMAAQDARVSYELNHKMSLLRAQITLRKAEQTLVDAKEALAEASATSAKAAGNARLAADATVALAQAKVAVQEAEVGLQSAQEARTDLDSGADATKVATAQADVEKKKLAVADAEIALAGANIVAPFDGTILQVNAAAGDTINANTVIVTLANLKQVQVVASIDETTIRQVAAGQKVGISFDAFPGQTFTGEVLSVPLQGALQGGVMVYDVPMSLAGAENLALRIGMTANAKIRVGEANNTLLIPTLALAKSNGMYQVLVPNSIDPAGQAETVPVEVGLSNGTYTQIIKGLIEGDQVLVEVSSSTSNNGFRMGGPGGGNSIMWA